MRAAFRQLFKDPTAKERSSEQCKAIMSTKKNTIITLKTIEGKSMLWMTASLINPNQYCIVICPFVVLLKEQVARCLQFRLQAHNFTKDKNGPLDILILFVQVESTSFKAFQAYVAMTWWAVILKLTSCLYSASWHCSKDFLLQKYLLTITMTFWYAIQIIRSHGFVLLYNFLSG